MTRQLRAVDAFAGAGGLSVGLGQAGFRVVAAVEQDPQAADTYALSHPGGPSPLVRDVTTVTGGDLTRRLRARLDLLAAGPPCQGFSLKGQRRSDHPGNAMLQQVVRLAQEIRPRAVLVENVVGLQSLAGGFYFDRLITALERVDLGGGDRYDVHFRVLNAADYGAPQLRRRLFIVAVEPGVTWRWPEQSTSPGDFTLADAISDLPPDAVDAGAVTRYGSSSMSLYAAPLRAGSPTVLNHHTKRLEDLRQRRIAALAPGQNRTFLTGELAAGGHETKYRRLRANVPCPTVTAHMGKDLSDFIHPTLPRTLTVREAARIQGFPDTHEFLGSQASQFRQVGNAVPVPLAGALGRALAQALSRQRRAPVGTRLILLPSVPPDHASLGVAATVTLPRRAVAMVQLEPATGVGRGA